MRKTNLANIIIYLLQQLTRAFKIEEGETDIEVCRSEE
jgi:hypothetical protein